MMVKTVVTVVAHNRKQNVERWVEAWSKAKIENAELRIIHNVHDNEPHDRIKDICYSAGVTYIQRKNEGMDIGAFQDVCRKRLHGFKYDFDYLLWSTDDTFPMRDTLVKEFIEPFNDIKVGLSCYEISPQVRKHVRTTGFCMRRETLERIVFEVDPIRTKDDCYQFEHRGKFSLFHQIHNMGLNIVQVSPVPSSPMWDSGGGGIKWPDREMEFLKMWKISLPPAKVIFIAPAYNKYPVVVSSLIAQTYSNWELHLVHDGAAPATFPRFDDDRVKFIETETRKKEYGHPIRIKWLQKIRSGDIQGKYVVITNDDNYHAPYFVEKLIRPLEENRELIGSYCSLMVHNYQGGENYNGTIVDGHSIDGYGIIDTGPEQGKIDCAAAMIRADIASNAGWPSTRHSSDWDYLNIIAQRNGGWDKMKRVFGALLVHN